MDGTYALNELKTNYRNNKPLIVLNPQSTLIPIY